jgi:hypothetical protein
MFHGEQIRRVGSERLKFWVKNGTKLLLTLL